MDTPPDHLVVVEEEYRDLSVISHAQSLPYHPTKDLSPVPRRGHDPARAVETDAGNPLTPEPPPG
nr:hypothetical protein KPHV_44150 [Kitasatospora purpeofusca]